MKQYCRYCVHLCAGNGTWCAEKKKELRDSTAKAVNHCKQFVFCEIDAYGETGGYKPRNSRRIEPTLDEVSGNQISMMDGGADK